MRFIAPALLLLGGCATVPSKPVIMTVDQRVAAQTTHEREDAKGDELQYQGAALALFLWLRSGVKEPDSLASVEDRAFESLKYLRLAPPGTDRHLAAKSAFNYSISELLTMIGEANAEPAHAH